MAEQQHREFKFVRVELKKTESLGTGSYGAVCKAKCDDLLCAAKVMHNVLFQFNDPGARTMLRRFEQECRFLSSMKHPNIVQYLATYHDPDSGLPVLIMELMDESLTRFLERAEHPPPIHTQVDFCHDIALALAYLHSNGIFHRDLSSNNVLLIGDRKAKVTDFGMSKLANVNPHITPQTMCPGTMVYMSPEALKEPPVYSEKLDCFSMGALIIQIATCNFPDPSERFTTLQVSDPRRPTHTIEVLASVPEVERRKTHIDLIEPSHPLLPIALNCVKDIDTERPSAHELCDQLDVVKAMPEYLHSKQQSVTQQLEDLRQQIQERENEIEDLQREKERESERHQQENEHLQQENEHLRQENEHLRQENEHLQQENEHLRQENEHLQQEVEDQKIFLHDKEYIIQQRDRIIRAKEDELQQYTSEARDKEDKNDITSITWKESKDAPAKIGRGTTAVIESMAYFSDDATGKVYEFDSKRERWSVLPDCKRKAFTLTVVDDVLTAVGGMGYQPKVPLSLTGRRGEWKWEEILPPMELGHVRPAVACSGNVLIVVGGGHSAVEILDTHTMQWSSAGMWFISLTYGSAHIHKGTVYLSGVHDSLGSRDDWMAMSLSKLLLEKNATDMYSGDFIMRTCFYRYTGALVQGQFLSIGGSAPYNSPEQVTNSIFKYYPATQQSEEISKMKHARSYSLVAVLPGNKIVVGGYTGEENTSLVEIGTF